MSATIATDVAADVATVPADVGAVHAHADAPHDVMLGRFIVEPYLVTVDRQAHAGGRFGLDMLIASGARATRFTSGIRFFLGGDGSGRFGTEGQLELGIAHAIDDRAVVALVAPLGFAIGGSTFGAHGYAGIEGVAAIGRFAREQGPAVRGVELAAGISTCGERARIGIVRPGHEMGFGVGVDWQRDGNADLVGLYLATVPGR